MTKGTVFKETPEYLQFIKLKSATTQQKQEFLRLSRKAQRWVLDELGVD